MNNTPLIFWIVPLASLVALGFAWYFFRAMMPAARERTA